MLCRQQDGHLPQHAIWGVPERIGNSPQRERLWQTSMLPLLPRYVQRRCAILHKQSMHVLILTLPVT